TPKCYGFDTGFVSFCRGWDPLRPEDMGSLWEHLVLEALQAEYPDATLHYWRDAAGREIDFAIPRSRDRVDVVECKWNPQDFDPAALKVFRSYYPGGRNYLVSPVNAPPYAKRMADQEVTVCNPSHLRQSAR
ncbi:MAG: DUF4143 domain-containing protein, partial [Planctomycetes bacterium]|nr:DUF4143 domain-containing protein [Planctomycetota bacterium]